MNAGKNKGAKNVKEMFEIFEYNSWQPLVEKKYNVPYETIKYLVIDQIIKKDWVSLLHGEFCD
jgi:hypothetical protein